MDIKPCPFCGFEAKLEMRYSRKFKADFIFIQCGFCRSQGRTFTLSNDYDEDELNEAYSKAIKAWNMRTLEQPD